MLILLSNPILTAYQGSDLFGKMIFLILLFLSIMTWTLFLKKLYFQKEARKKGFYFQEAFQKRQLYPLSLEIGSVNHPFAMIYRSIKLQTTKILNQKEDSFLTNNEYELIEASVTSAISIQIQQMNKNLFILPTVMSLAPFLGLLGTVWGILLTFGELQTGSAVNANATIMGGLAMALGTTVVGLLVAIPALIAYNYLRATTSHFATELEDFSQYCLACVKLQNQNEKKTP